MKKNRHTTPVPVLTHENGVADPHIKPLEELRRTVATCLLWEPTFYEKGDAIAKRIADLCDQVSPAEIAGLALEARFDHKLRHVPLWLCVQLVRRMDALHQGNELFRVARALVANTIDGVIRRPDQMGELVALYFAMRGGRKMLPRQMKLGLARAFQRCTEYQLAKWNRDADIKLRDVLFLCHAKPTSPEQELLWKRLIAGELAPPDTWEVALSSGADKRETWERLLTEHKLGYMALLMNLRNMVEAGVDREMIEVAIESGAAGSWALPFRFVTALRVVPHLLRALDIAMARSLAHQRGEGALTELGGETAIVVDVSGSMDDPLAALRRPGAVPTSRLDAAGALAVLAGAQCPRHRVFTFSDSLVEIPPVRGLGLLESIRTSQAHRGTYLGAALTSLQTKRGFTRVLVITDEQSADRLPPCWVEHGYVLNVAPYKPGLEAQRGGWHRINGFSERVLDWVAITEREAVR